jgi:hypothetical protein
MDSTNNRLLHPIVCSAAFAALLLGCNKPSNSEDSGIVRQETPPVDNRHADVMPAPGSDSPGSQASKDEQKTDSPTGTTQAEPAINDARTVAAAIDSAIVAIDGGKQPDAQAEVTKALDELARLRQGRPNVDLIVSLWQGNRTTTGVDKDEFDTMPLLERLIRDDMPVYQREKLEARLEHRKGQAAGSASKDDKFLDLEIVDASIVYDPVDMPIAMAEVHVREAQRLLDEDKLTAAKHALTRAVAAVRVIENIDETPEYRARNSIWAAQSAFSKDDINEAKRLLKEANDLLAPLGKQADDSEGQTMVNLLLADMQPVQTLLDAGGKPSADLFTRLEHNASNLVRRNALRQVLIARRETERLALADALMWLEKARTDGLSLPDTNVAASRDLTLAEAALSKASKAVPASAKPQIDDLHGRVAQLIERDTAKSRKTDELETELRGVTYELRMLMLDLGAAPTSTPNL